ncbi:MAG: Gfo/Idh/MocA family protein [Opitutales bacterium]
MEREIRWGLLGPGRIARAVAAETATMPGMRFTAVASRDEGRARAFAEEFGVERAYGDYARLLADPAVEAVYVAVPHNHHLALVQEALAAGKGVLCEKPLGLSEAEVEAMVASARAGGRFLMEAVTTRFIPTIAQVQAWVCEGAIGEPGLLQAFFCFDAGDDAAGRHLNPALAGGALRDLGVYPLTLAEMLLGEGPGRTVASAALAPTGVDATTSMTVHYPGGTVAQLTVSVGRAAGVHATLWGSQGRIEIPAFHAPAVAHLHRDGEERRTFAAEPAGRFRFEFEEANRCLREGLLESPRMRWGDSLRLARWQDAILAQIAAGG